MWKFLPNIRTNKIYTFNKSIALLEKKFTIMGKNLVNVIGKITKEDQIKMYRKASREETLGNGFKSTHKTHKDKRREANRKACRSFRF